MSGAIPAALSLAIMVLEALPALIKAGQDIACLVATTVASLREMQAESRVPTVDEWSSITGALARLTAQIEQAAKPNAPKA